MRNPISAFVFFVLSVPAVWAQSGPATLRGRVLDPEQTVVPSAEVRLYSRTLPVEWSATADGEGRYQFENIPAGHYLIEARAENLDQSTPAALTLQGGEKASLDLQLKIQITSARVSVTASASALPTGEGGKAMDVIDRAELDRRNEITLTESLRQVPGFRVQQLGGPGTFSRILVRGLRAYDTAIAIDGMRFRDPSAVQGDATSFLGDLLVVDSDRVEVLRGSGSSIYGTNAIGGVINMVTDQGGGAPHGEVSAEGGGLGLARGLARVSGGWAENRFQYSAGLAHLNVTRGVDGVQPVRNTSGQGSFLFRPTATTSLSVRTLGNFGTLGLTTSPVAAPMANLPAGNGLVQAIALPGDQVRLLEQGLPVQWGRATFAPNLADPDARRIGNFTSTLVAWNQQVHPRFHYRVAWQGYQSGRDNRDGTAGPVDYVLGLYQPSFNTVDLYQGRIDTVQARGDVQLAQRHLLSFGYEWERENYRNHSLDANPDPIYRIDSRVDSTQRSHSGYVQEQSRFLHDRLVLALSGRVQHFDLDLPAFQGGASPYANVALSSPDNAYTGDAALSYFVPSTSTRIRSHVGNGYRAPSLYERFGSSFYLGSFTPYGDPRLRPERSLAVDGGVDQYFANSRARLSATYFYTRLQETIGFGTPSSDPFGRIFGGYLNTRGGLARGVEISGEARPWRTLLLSASYTDTNADERRSILTDQTLRTIRVFPHAFSFVATQQVTKRMQVTADFIAGSDYVSGTFFVGTGTRPYQFGGPRKLDFSVDYTVPVSDRFSMKLFTRVENALNQTYYEDGFRTPKAWATGGLKFLF